jgi:lysophospholipid acyltransferase (LPLAT)-like uncharacterized protein
VAEFSFRQRIVLAVVPRVVALILRVLGSTLRYEDVFPAGARDPIPGDAYPGPTVYAFWHRSLLACAHRFRKKDIAILISQSFDGELIARTVELLGFKAVRGSSSRGGASGLRAMSEAYTAGHRCAFTADGPRGPSMVAKAGPAQLAKLVEAPWVGAFYALPVRAWELKTWDRFLIPKPFSRVYVSFPEHVPANAADLQAGIQAALDEAVVMAENARRLASDHVARP